MTGSEQSALAFECSEETPAADTYLVAPVLTCLRQSGARRVLGLDASASGTRIASRLMPSAAFIEHRVGRIPMLAKSMVVESRVMQ